MGKRKRKEIRVAAMAALLLEKYRIELAKEIGRAVAGIFERHYPPMPRRRGKSFFGGVVGKGSKKPMAHEFLFQGEEVRPPAPYTGPEREIAPRVKIEVIKTPPAVDEIRRTAKAVERERLVK